MKNLFTNPAFPPDKEASNHRWNGILPNFYGFVRMLTLIQH
jgi:hypothetical protein